MLDEPAHLAAGLSHWEFADFHLYAVNPPLVRGVAALPVWCLRPAVDWTQASTEVWRRTEVDTGRRFIAANGESSLRYLLLARLACLPFFWWLLRVTSCWARTVTKCPGAGLAAAVVAVSPMTLAFGSVITPDLAAATMSIAAMWRFRALLHEPSLHRTILLGVILGLAFLTKFTCLLVLPCSMAVCAVLTVRGNRRRLVKHLSGALLIAIVVVNVGYCWQGTFRPIGSIPFVSSHLRSGLIPGSVSAPSRFTDSILAPVPSLLPLPFLQGLDVQKRDFETGFPSYLAGHWAETGWWYWYACAFVVKEPLGFQILLLVSVLHGLWQWRLWTRESIREWSMILVPLAVTFALVSSQTGFTHHLRYLLPAYPFLFVLASRVISPGAGGKWLTALCLLWQAVNVLCAAPHWMSWFNEAAGGPQNGSRWLLHSNLDWGQDLLFLKDWQQSHPEAMPLHAALMTAFDPRDLGLRVRPGVPCLKDRPDVVNADGLRGPVAGWHAISVNLLNERVISKTDPDSPWANSGRYVYLKDHFRPVARIGDTIQIFHLTEADVAGFHESLTSADPGSPERGPETRRK